MSSAILYTVLSLVNLTGFLIGMAFLPEWVPVHFDALGGVDGFGSPWSYAAFPAAAALLTLGIWVAGLKKGRRAALYTALLALLGAALVCIGWVFFGFAAQSLTLGEKAVFPYPAVTVLPLALILIVLGVYLPRIGFDSALGIRTSATLGDALIWELTHKFGRWAFLAAGLVSAASAILFSCLDTVPRLDYLSVAVLCVSVAAAAAACCIRAEVLYKRRKNAEGDVSFEASGKK